MKKYLLPVCFLLLISKLLSFQETLTLDQIITEIATEIQTGQPIFLDINCGEWNPVLTQKLSTNLLEKGADLRYNLSETKTDISSLEEKKVPDLSVLGLEKALLVQINLNIAWQETVKSSFFSYRTERYPVHIFEIRQIQLPTQQILKISTHNLPRPNPDVSGTSSFHFRWFEPLVAGAAIGSLIFLLWNFD